MCRYSGNVHLCGLGTCSQNTLSKTVTLQSHNGTHQHRCNDGLTCGWTGLKLGSTMDMSYTEATQSDTHTFQDLDDIDHAKEKERKKRERKHLESQSMNAIPLKRPLHTAETELKRLLDQSNNRPAVKKMRYSTNSVLDRRMKQTAAPEKDFDAATRQSTTGVYHSKYNTFQRAINRAVIPLLASKEKRCILTEDEITSWITTATVLWTSFDKSSQADWKRYKKIAKPHYHVTAVLMLMKDASLNDNRAPYIETLAKRLPSKNKIQNSDIIPKRLTQCIKICKRLLFALPREPVK